MRATRSASELAASCTPRASVDEPRAFAVGASRAARAWSGGVSASAVTAEDSPGERRRFTAPAPERDSGEVLASDGVFAARLPKTSPQLQAGHVNRFFK